MTTLSISTLRTSICAAVLALASLSSTAGAQSHSPVLMANVPFAFEVGSHHFAAGRYTVRMEADHIMSITGRSGSVTTMTMWDGQSKPSARSKIVFRNYGGRLFLHEVWSAGDRDHLLCTESKAEKQARISELASNREEAAEVELALVQTGS
jgi:hypothetical protein